MILSADVSNHKDANRNLWDYRLQIIPSRIQRTGTNPALAAKFASTGKDSLDTLVAHSSVKRDGPSLRPRGLLRTQNIVEEEIDFLPLQAVRMRSNGKRDYERVAKRPLVQLCLSSGASASSMALKAGINANQLSKWIGQNRMTLQSSEGALSAFVPSWTPCSRLQRSRPRRLLPAIGAA